jgi:hypothetical protein
MQAATQPLETLQRGRIALNDQAITRAYQNAIVESQRNYNQKVTEDARRYQEGQHQQLRTETKADAEETYSKQIDRDYAAAGGTDPNLTTPQKAAAMSGLKLAGAIKDNLALEVGKLQNKAEMMGVTTMWPDGVPVSHAELAKQIAISESKQEAALRTQHDMDLINEVVNNPVKAENGKTIWENAQSDYGNFLLDRNLPRARAVIPDAQAHPGMTPVTQKALGQLLLNNEKFQAELLTLKPNQQSIVRTGLTSGMPGSVIAAVDKLDPATKARLQQIIFEQSDMLAKAGAMDQAINQRTDANAYLRDLTNVARGQQNDTTDRINFLNSLDEKYGMQVGLALKRMTSEDKLVNQALNERNGTTPIWGAGRVRNPATGFGGRQSGGAGGNGILTLPPDGTQPPPPGGINAPPLSPQELSLMGTAGIPQAAMPAVQQVMPNYASLPPADIMPGATARAISNLQAAAAPVGIVNPQGMVRQVVPMFHGAGASFSEPSRMIPATFQEIIQQRAQEATQQGDILKAADLLRQLYPGQTSLPAQYQAPIQNVSDLLSILRAQQPSPYE